MKISIERHKLKLPLSMLLVASCFGSAALIAQDEPTGDTASRTSDAALEMRKEATDGKPLERVDLKESAPVVGEVSEDLLNSVYSELEKLTGDKPSGFEVLRAEAVRWNDGGLGCPEPGVMYQHAPVDGYWVVVNDQGKEYDYRGTALGHFRLCAAPTFDRNSYPSH